MSGLVAIVEWDRASASTREVERLLDLVPHRTTDGRATAALGSCALGFARRATTARALAEQQPRVDSARRVAVVADARLDDREDLARALSLDPAQASDLDLLLGGWERWGTALPERLAGEFAFVIWDDRRRELFAARDAFATRPLFVARRAGGLALATELGQLLALAGVDRAVEPRAVLDYLIDECTLEGETFFAGVRRLFPGHALLARAGGSVEERRWWTPPEARPEPRAAERVLDLLRAAVRDRLESSGPVVAQLSGGIDSSSVVRVADELYRREPRRPPLRVVSSIFPGRASDETRWLELATRGLVFTCERQDPARLAVDQDEPFFPDHPWRELGPSTSDVWREVATRAGARVVLTGLGGDELFFERGVYRDLLANGQLLTLVREARLAPLYSTHSTGHYLSDAVRAAAPAALRRLYRRVRPRRPESPPPWLGGSLRDAFAAHVVRPPPPVPEQLSSHTQRMTWSWLTSPRLTTGIEVATLDAARRGFELRHPFLDRRLAAFVLSVPWPRRVPSGFMKRLLREALSPLLPPEIAWRTGVTSFETELRSTARSRLDLLRDVIESGPWHAEAWVDRGWARRALADLAADVPSADARQVWDVATLERWARGLARLPAP